MKAKSQAEIDIVDKINAITDTITGLENSIKVLQAELIVVRNNAY